MKKNHALFDPAILKPALWESLKRLDPRHQIKNPVMFVVEVGSVMATGLWVQALGGHGEAPAGFILSVTLWLWFTVIFANFAEAMAEGRGRAQAATLRASRKETPAKKLPKGHRGDTPVAVSANQLRQGDVVLVDAGDLIPMDGEVIEGVASVNEAAITGESAPVIRESGGDRSAVTGGTQVLSDWLVVRITANPGETFLDRMISMVEGAKRQKTPNEIALNILLAGMTIIFLLATVTLLPFSIYSVKAAGSGSAVPVSVLVALLVCLIPTTIGGLLPAIGIAGMDRMIQANVVALSGRAVEAAGDVDVLLLDKTGTITLGNRQAVAFVPTETTVLSPGNEGDLGSSESRLADAAQIASLSDETPEGRSIVVLAKEKYGLRARRVHELGATFIPFTAQTRMSGVDLHDGRRIRKGAADAIETYVKQQGGSFPANVRKAVEDIARSGGTPLVVADRQTVLGVVHLKDIVKGGIKERFAELRRMGIKTVMITGDNALTAAAIAAEAGVDDFLANATPEAKLKLIRESQSGGRLVAMTGLAQALFPDQANGSLIRREDKWVGSKVIGQNFTDPRYFWGRLSATGPTPYNGASSSGSNLGPMNPALGKAAQDRIDALRSGDPENPSPIPVDLVTASASGLDPHITPAAAFYQMKRVARVRRISEQTVERLISENTDGRFLGILGEPGVNVLKLNLALDALSRAGPDGALAVDAGDPAAFAWTENERSVARWVYDKGQMAGAGSDTLSGAVGLYLPLKGIRSTVGVLGIRPATDREFLDPDLNNG